jgi:zinc protease
MRMLMQTTQTFRLIQPPSGRLLAFGLVWLSLCAAMRTPAQEKPPGPSAPRSVAVPAVTEKKLPNGLTVAVVERKNVPLVTIQVLIRSGASNESADQAGLANLTADLLTKGTKTRTATQIAEAIEYIGGSIATGSFWNGSFANVTVTSDKVDQALGILADVVLNPKFDETELGLLKSQTLDGLAASLKQPSFIAGYAASRFSFDEHPVGGTPVSIQKIDAKAVRSFYGNGYRPSAAVLIFAGDISPLRATGLATRYFGAWKNPSGSQPSEASNVDAAQPRRPRLLVIDLPQSGQAAVIYTKKLPQGRYKGNGDFFYTAQTFNSVLGGGYSSRMNLEIRVKRGLSYGASSTVRWRPFAANLSGQAQTKNESAAEVASLLLAQLDDLSANAVDDKELVPRKSVLTGNFDRNIESTSGLATAVSDLYAFDVPKDELSRYVNSVEAVTKDSIRRFGDAYTHGGDLIIVGDYSVFKGDLAKRYPKMELTVIKADDLDLSNDSLHK